MPHRTAINACAAPSHPPPRLGRQTAGTRMYPPAPYGPCNHAAGQPERLPPRWCDVAATACECLAIEEANEQVVHQHPSGGYQPPEADLVDRWVGLRVSTLKPA